MIGRWRRWCKNTFFFPTKRLAFFTITSRLTHKARGERHGLVNLYKDMESCRGYPDIQVMWEMLQSSSCTPNTNTNIININNTTSKRCSSSSSWSWRFCFKPAA